MKLSCVYQASLVQINKLKRQHHRTFGLENLSKVCNSWNESIDGHSVPHFNRPDGAEDIHHINRTVFENLPVRLIRLVLKAFFALKEDFGSEDHMSSPSVVDEKLKFCSNDKTTALSDNTCGYQISEDNRKAENVTEHRSEYTSPPRGISPLGNSGDIRLLTKHAHVVQDTNARELPTGPSIQSSHDVYNLYGIENMSKEELKNQIAK